MELKSEVESEVIDREILQIKPHPLNRKLYGHIDPGTADMQDLIENIKQMGFLHPILIDRDMQIVSGHRRWAAAKALEIERVPCQEHSGAALEIEEAIVYANTQRVKSSEMKAREFKELKRIKQEKAKRRQGKRNDLKQDDDSNIPESFPESGDARDIAAMQVGFGSGRTAEKAEVVVDKMDNLEESGDTVAARDLRDTLEKSVDGAHKKVTGKTSPETITSPEDVLQYHLKKLQQTWNNAPETAREAFVDWIKAQKEAA
jgi:hypothetical protein